MSCQRCGLSHMGEADESLCLNKKLTEANALLLRWREIGHGFTEPAGAIIAHSEKCRVYTLLTRGDKPTKRDCTCKAKIVAEKVLALMIETQGLEKAP